MIDQKIKLITGSLLHDIGKVVTGKAVTEEIIVYQDMIFLKKREK